jgi:hypothetical protein
MRYMLLWRASAERFSGPGRARAVSAPQTTAARASATTLPVSAFYSVLPASSACRSVLSLPSSASCSALYASASATVEMGGGNAQVRLGWEQRCGLLTQLSSQKTAMSRARNQAKLDGAKGQSQLKQNEAALTLKARDVTRSCAGHEAVTALQPLKGVVPHTERRSARFACSPSSAPAQRRS